MIGWIKLHRKMMEWEWFDDPLTAHLFLYMILRANRFPDKWRGIDVGVGQFITSLGKLSQKTGLSVQQVRTCIGRLKSTQEITQTPTSRYTMITVCNYSSYQISDDDTNTTSNTTSNKQSTSVQQTINKQSTTNKESKKEKKAKKFVPPTFEELESYCALKGFSHIARKAFDYYSEGDWTDASGKPIKSWKRKLISVWFDHDRNPAPKTIQGQFTEENADECRKAMEDAEAHIKRVGQANPQRDSARARFAQSALGQL